MMTKGIVSALFLTLMVLSLNVAAAKTTHRVPPTLSQRGITSFQLMRSNGTVYENGTIFYDLQAGLLRMDHHHHNSSSINSTIISEAGEMWNYSTSGNCTHIKHQHGNFSEVADLFRLPENITFMGKTMIQGFPCQIWGGRNYSGPSNRTYYIAMVSAHKGFPIRVITNVSQEQEEEGEAGEESNSTLIYEMVENNKPQLQSIDSDIFNPFLHSRCVQPIGSQNWTLLVKAVNNKTGGHLRNVTVSLGVKKMNYVAQSEEEEAIVEMTELNTNTYLMTVSAPGYQSTQQSIRIRHDSHVTVRLQPLRKQHQQRRHHHQK